MAVDSSAGKGRNTVIEGSVWRRVEERFFFLTIKSVYFLLVVSFLKCSCELARMFQEEICLLAVGMTWKTSQWICERRIGRTGKFELILLRISSAVLSGSFWFAKSWKLCGSDVSILEGVQLGHMVDGSYYMHRYGRNGVLQKVQVCVIWGRF